ncbi:hypothetical protein COCON_G00211530, partial [Conger conger]
RLPDLLGVGPDDVADAALDVREDDHGEDHQEGDRPHRPVHGLRHLRPAPPGGADGVHHGQVAVDAHDRQAEDAGELVDAVHRHHQTAHDGAEGPGVEGGLHGQEGQAQHEELVGDGQVEDVDVGDRLALGVAQHDVDDQRVAAQADDADGDVDEGDQHAGDGGALGHGRVAPVARQEAAVQPRVIEQGVVEQGVVQQGVVEEAVVEDDEERLGGAECKNNDGKCAIIWMKTMSTSRLSEMADL